MKALLVAAGAAAVALTSPVAAQTAGQTFEGPYVGAQVGFNHDSYGHVDTRNGPVAIDQNRDSFAGGVYAGYDHHLIDNVVIGVEGGFDLHANDRVLSHSRNASIDPRYSFSLGARVGYQVDPKTLVYVRGGYENTDARVRYMVGTGSASDTRTFDGWTAGGGVERYLTDKVSARVEYRYSDLGGDDTRFHRHEGLFGISYHF